MKYIKTKEYNNHNKTSQKVSCSNAYSMFSIPVLT
jgi:hypothetical protein